MIEGLIRTSRPVLAAVHRSRIARTSVVRRLYNVAWTPFSNRTATVRTAAGLMEVDLRDHPISRTLFLTGHYEPGISHIFRERLRPGDTVIDIGAHVGWFTLLGAGLVGDTGRVFAFEPSPISFERLKRNISLNGRHQIAAFNVALSDKAGSACLVSDQRGNSGANYVAWASTGADTLQGVTVSSLDEATAGLAVHPALIKIDTEGSEVRVLKGMRRVLEESPGTQLIVEYWPYGLRRAGDEPEALLDCLHGYGYELRRIDEASGDTVPVTDSELLDAPGGRGHDNLLCVRG